MTALKVLAVLASWAVTGFIGYRTAHWSRLDYVLAVERVVARVAVRLTGAAGPHWFRTLDGRDACSFTGCGRSAVQHWQHVGEWTLPARERWRRVLVRARLRFIGFDR